MLLLGDALSLGQDSDPVFNPVDILLSLAAETC